MSVRVDRGVSRGTLSLDGQTFDVDNNIWVVGDDSECLVIDAPHDIGDILAVVGNRKVKAIVCTHAHDDHVRVAPELRDRTGAPILLHPADEPLWKLTHSDHRWDLDLTDGATIGVGGTTLHALHTPGHTPGAASTLPTSAASSPVTRSSTAAPAPPPAPTLTGTSSRSRSARSCSRCPTTPSCTPATATTPRSAPRKPTRS